MRRKEERGSFSFEGNVVWLEAATRVLPKPQSNDPGRPRLRSDSPAAVGPGFIPPNFQLPKPLVRSSVRNRSIVESSFSDLCLEGEVQRRNFLPNDADVQLKLVIGKDDDGFIILGLHLQMVSARAMGWWKLCVVGQFPWEF